MGRMTKNEIDNRQQDHEPVEPGRRNFLKGGAAVAGAGLTAAGVAGAATPAAAAGGQFPGEAVLPAGGGASC